MELSVIPETEADRQTAFLAFSAILGGGVVAYQAGRSIRDGDLFKTEPFEGNAEVGLVATAAGVGMLGFAANEAAKSVGWKPLILGSVGIFAFAIVARAIRK